MPLTSRINPYGGDLSHTIKLIDNDDQIIDITALVLEFNIYEGIFNQTLSADFVVRDSVGIIDGQSPLTGQEFVELTFNSSSASILGASPELLFKVHKVGSKTEITPGTTVFSLSCSSPELEENITKSVKNSYKDKLGSEAVADIFKQYIDLGGSKGIDIEETENVVPYTPANHSPFEAIEVIGRESRSKTYGDASHYLFFETTQGFRFRTISSLLNQKPAEDAAYYFSDPGAPDNNLRERSIIGHTFLDNVDTIDLLGKGFYDNNVGVIDPLTKTFSETRFNYANDFAKLPHIVGGGSPTLNLNKSRILGSEIPGSGQSRFLVGDLAKISSNNVTFDDRITPDNDPHIFNSRERYRKTPLVAAQLASLRQHGIDITVPVNMTINAGDIIRIFIPAAKDRRTELAFIEHYGPNPTFLVVSTNTRLTVNGDYLTTMQCVKESFGIDVRGRPIQFNNIQNNFFNNLGSLLIDYSNQSTTEYGVTTDNTIGVVSGTLSSVVASAGSQALSTVTEKATQQVEKQLSDAAAAEADPNADGADEVATDASSLGENIDKELDTAAENIEAEIETLAEDAVKDITNAAVATGVALATSKIMSSLNISPAKMAKLIQIIKLLEKIPIFKGPITEVKADLAAAQDNVTSGVQSASDSVSSAVTGGGD